MASVEDKNDLDNVLEPLFALKILATGKSMHIKFSIFHDEVITKHACSLLDFVFRLPNLVSRKNKLIPPKQVFSETFSKGILVANTGGILEWNGFNLNESELDVLFSQLEKKGYRYAEPPIWVCNRETWMIWKYEYLNHIPSKKCLAMYNQLYEVEQAMEVAEQDNQTALLNKLAQEKARVTSRLSDYVSDQMSG